MRPRLILSFLGHFRSTAPVYMFQQQSRDSVYFGTLGARPTLDLGFISFFVDDSLRTLCKVGAGFGVFYLM